VCHSRDFRTFEVRKETKPEETRAAQDRRAATIDNMLGDANRQAEQARPEPAPVREAAPAK
jgi:hypothetical protein